MYFKNVPRNETSARIIMLPFIIFPVCPYVKVETPNLKKLITSILMVFFFVLVQQDTVPTF